MQRGWGLGGSAARWSLQRPGGLLRSVLPSSMCQGHFSLGSREVMSSKEEMFSSCSLFLLSEKSFLRRFPITIPQEIFSGLSLIRIKSEPIMDKKMRPLWCLKPVLMPSLGGGRDRELLPWTYGRENTWTELGLCWQEVKEMKEGCEVCI